MNSLQKFLDKKGIKLSNEQTILVCDIIQLVTLLNIRMSRGGKTFALKLVDEYFDQVLPKDCTVAKYLAKKTPTIGD